MAKCIEKCWATGFHTSAQVVEGADDVEVGLLGRLHLPAKFPRDGGLDLVAQAEWSHSA